MLIKAKGSKLKKQLPNLILKISAASVSFPTLISFFSEPKLRASPLQFMWEFFTIHWCVWNTILTLIYNWREMKKREQPRLGLVVAVSNFITTVLFTLVLLKKPELIGNSSWWWWFYTFFWHYVGPIASLSYFFIFDKNEKIQKFSSAVLFIHPLVFTAVNFMRKWTLVYWNKLEFLGETKKEKEVKFKKFMVEWFKDIDYWIEKIKRKEEILTSILCIVLYLKATFCSFWLIAYLLKRIKKFLSPCQKNRINILYKEKR